MSNDFENIFDVNLSDVFTKNDSKESDFYTPSAKDGKDKVYTAKIKFLPNIFNVKDSLIDKYATFLENPETNDKRMIDCPSTVKQKSLLQEAFFSLRESNSAIEQELSKKFSRTRQCFSPVLIIEDENKPELVGKIKIFRFGQQIYDIIKEMSENKDEEERNNPFNIFEGRTLILKVVEKSSGSQKFNNFSTSSFSRNVSPIIIDGKKIKNTPEDLKILKEWLLENTPEKIKDCAYKEWDDDTRSYVVNAIKAIVPTGKTLDKLLKRTPTTSTANSKVTKKQTDEDIDEIYDTKPTKKPTKKVEEPVEDDDVSFDEEDFDNLLNDDDDDF